MAQKLTVKQEGFCLAVAEGQSQADAYRANYSAANWADATVHEAASRLRKNSKVVARLKELRAMAAERTLVTVESLTLELDENRTEARRLGQASAMNAATMGKAKLHGLLTDKLDVNAPPERIVFDVIIPGISKPLRGKPNGPHQGGA